MKAHVSAYFFADYIRPLVVLVAVVRAVSLATVDPLQIYGGNKNTVLSVGVATFAVYTLIFVLELIVRELYYDIARVIQEILDLGMALDEMQGVLREQAELERLG